MSASLEAAYRRYFPLIREKCARMLGDGDEAQDVAQETFLRLWRLQLAHSVPLARDQADEGRAAHADCSALERPTGRSGLADEDPRRLTAWIYRTSTHLAVDRIRRRRFQAEAPLEREGGCMEGLVLARQELLRIARRVPAEELAIAVLHRLDGLGQEEIAEVADVSDRTVRRMLKRFDERIARLREEA